MKNKKSSEKFLAGLSGLQLPVPKYLFPEAHQQSSRLTYYSTFFNSIEINSSFYKLPQPKTIERWMREVPDDFRFTFKMWKEVTHVKELMFEEDHVKAFFNAIAGAHKKGCILVQFPPSLSANYFMQLEALLHCIQGLNTQSGWRIALEFRNVSWYSAKTYRLLQNCGAALVMHDIPKSRTPFMEHSSDFLYLRFHGPGGKYRGSYDDDFLEEYSGYIQDWLSQPKTVFVYFNNTMGDAFRNLQTLQQFFLKREDHF